MKDSILIDKLNSILTNCQFRELTEPEVENIENIISHFDSLNNYTQVVLSEALEIKKNQQISFLLLLSMTFSYKSTKSPQNETRFSEYELIGIATLKKDYGRVLIRPETIADKINNLFLSTDIDFDFNKDFSKKYYVVANDETKVRNCISNSFLETIRGFNDLEIELDGHILMVRLRQQFTQENGEIITNFLTAINDGYN
ncbi:MAG: hypothetical protein Q7U54_18480 [Bacteroidales bacterium]|nr:hypothetical protein [Bacteroidales bacterium]